MAYLDFDTIVICNNDFSDLFVDECFSFFHALGIRNFIVTYDFDATARSIPEAIRTLRTLKPYLHTFQPHGTRVYTACNLLFEPDITFHPMLSQLALSAGDRLFITLPLFNGNEWLEPDLSHLIYRKHFRPIFTSFERNAITYDDAMFERFARLPKVTFALDANYIFSLHAQPKLTHMIRIGASIIPCVSNRMTDYVAVLDGYRDLQSRLGLKRYRELCKNIRETSVSLRQDFTVRGRSSSKAP